MHAFGKERGTLTLLGNSDAGCPVELTCLSNQSDVFVSGEYYRGYSTSQLDAYVYSYSGLAHRLKERSDSYLLEA